MAQDVLGKTVRIDDKRYDPKGAKLEVWTKGRHKYLIRYVDPEGKNAPESSKILYINTTGKAEKPNASLSDDEVIKEYLLEIKQTVLFNIEVGLSPHPMCHQILKVIQDPYSNETINKRIYGDGSPYYLNNGCSISIEWLGQKPNPDFFLGTFSNPNDAEKYYRRNLIPKESVSGFNKKRGPSRYLRLERDTTRLADGIDRNAAWYLLNGAHKGFNKDGVVILPESPEEDGVIITSGVDNADDSSTLPTSSWVIDEGTVNPINDFDNDGIDDLFEGPFSEGLFRDESYVWHKKVTIKLPEGVNEEKLVWTNKMDNLQYISNSLPEGSEYNKTILVPTGFTGSNGEPGMRPVEVTETKPIIQYFRSSQKDSNIILEVIERFKSMVISKNGIQDYDLKLCSPDSESCKFIDYISPLEDIKPVTPVEPVAAADAPPVDNGKIKLNIQGLFDIDGTTPGSSQSVFEIKAKTTMPSFLVWTGEIPKTEEIDVFVDLQELDDEYVETDFAGEGENLLTFEESEAIEEELRSQNNNDNNNNNNNNEGTGDEGTGDKGTGEFKAENLTNLPKITDPGKTTTQKFPLEFNGVPYYAQWDSRWGQQTYSEKNSSGVVTEKCKEKNGSESNLKTSGCGVTSVVMVINYWAKLGKTGGKFTTPSQLAEIFSRNGGRMCGSGSRMGTDGVKKYLEKEFGLTWKLLGSGNEVLNKALKKGYPIVIGGQEYSGLTPAGTIRNSTTQGHYMVATGIDSGGYIRINDPGYATANVISAFADGKIKGGSNTPRYNVLIWPKGQSAPV